MLSELNIVIRRTLASIQIFAETGDKLRNIQQYYVI